MGLDRARDPRPLEPPTDLESSAWLSMRSGHSPPSSPTEQQRLQRLAGFAARQFESTIGEMERSTPDGAA
jgi:hypothetical protein